MRDGADFGVVKPDPLAYAAAHRAIEADLGRMVSHDEVWFTDDPDENVAVVRAVGGDAELVRRA